MNHTHSKLDEHMRHQGEADGNQWFCMKCARVVETDE